MAKNNNIITNYYVNVICDPVNQFNMEGSPTPHFLPQSRARPCTGWLSPPISLIAEALVRVVVAMVTMAVVAMMVTMVSG